MGMDKKKEYASGQKSYAVLGLGKFGRSVAVELASAGAEVLAVDIDAEKVHDIAPYVTTAVRADVCDVDAIKSFGLSNFDGVIVAITSSLDASVLATITAKEEGVPYIFAKTSDQTHATILEKVGADKVLIPEKESGIRLARMLTVGKFKDFIELSDNVKMIEIEVKESWLGKTLRALNLRQKEKINVVCARKDGEIIANLDPDMPLSDEYTLIVTIKKEDISRFATK